MTQREGSPTKPKLTWIVIPVAVLFAVLIPLATVLFGKWMDLVAHLPAFPPVPLNFILGPTVMTAGYALCAGSIYQLYRGGRGLPWGPVEARAESTQLVTTGLYAFTRNPMILGMLLVLSGLGWLVQSITAILVIPLIALTLLYIWLRVREEPQLEQRFGEAYRRYKQRTPRLFPRPFRRPETPLKSPQEGNH
jgi:protein-S-isoprenylcysteine O-methyltransferase Ste14